MKLSPLITITIVALSVSSVMARRTGRGWNRDDDDDWWGSSSKSSKSSGKSSKSWWGGWKDDDDDDWKGWRGYNHKKQHKKKLHHKRRNGHRNHWGRDLVGKNFDAANEVAVEEEVHDPSGK
ncbi:hypothetical protein ACHAWO_000882 [Cyclotella atomus]|uniref:Uncharacterized protein n=1 Tax=Cyclotella atomus TaxID=382360 RepID=A0ABD3PX10_9STRA